MGTGELLGKPNKFQGVRCNGLASCPRGVEILLATSCYRNQDGPMSQSGSKPSLTLVLTGFQTTQACLQVNLT